jgi:hypothetical protein
MGKGLATREIHHHSKGELSAGVEGRTNVFEEPESLFLWEH